ncbi:hypothetical protein KKF32_01755 [Patescibacteria group bacterium]|nr:hypothetical protein [Patescibacteria group bacterium]
MKLSRYEIIKYSILLIILGGAFFFVFLPNFKNIQKINSDLSSQRANLEQQFKAKKNLEEFLADYHSIKSEIPSYEQMFTKEGDELSLITIVENIAIKYNISQDITLGTQKERIDNHLKRMTFNLSVNGDFNNFVNYLLELKLLNYKLIIRSLEIEKLEESKVTAELLGYTYWYLP